MRRPLACLLALTLVAGCGSDEGDARFIRIAFDGSTWAATPGDAQLTFTVDDPEGAGVWISLASRPHGGGNQLFSLGLPNPVEVGTYPLNGVSGYAAFLSCPSDVLADCVSWKVVPSHPGTLKITDVDAETGVARGTFSFNGYLLGDSTASAKSFTGGAFAIRVGGPVPALTAH